MTTSKRRQHRRWLREHRLERYLHAIQKVIDGKAQPEYASERWGKLKQITK